LQVTSEGRRLAGQPSCGPERICDLDTNHPVQAGTNLPDVAVDPNTGAVYVGWADGRFSGGA